MLRQKFIDRLRKKYQTGGVSDSTDIKKTGSLGLKLLKYGPLARSMFSKALGPVSTLLGSTTAYAPPVIDSTGANTYTREQEYTPFGQIPSYNRRKGINMADASTQISAAMAPKINQTGGMYNQMQQYQGGGKKGEFGSGRDAYTDEEWTNMSSADRNRALGKIGGGRPGNYTGIKIPDPDWYSEQIISHYRKSDEEKVLDLSDADLDKIKRIADSKSLTGASANEKTLQALYNRADSTGRIDRDYYTMLGHIQGNSNWNPKYSSETQGIQPMTKEEFNDIIDKKQTGGVSGPGMNIMQQYQLQNSPIVPPVTPPTPPVPALSLIERAEKSGVIGRGRNIMQRQTGGMQLPGGEMAQIPGTDAFEFAGAGHDEGGILLDPRTEVEDGETMDQVTMARGGGPRDYFFSSHLKKGGVSYADMHKDILRDGGDQQEIDYLAQMQEQAAGRDPNQVAKLGGIMKYQAGGEGYPSTGGYTTDASGYNIELPDVGGIPGLPDYLEREEKPSQVKQFFTNLFKKKELTDEEKYQRSIQRKTPSEVYIGGASQLLPAAYSLLHKQPEAQQIDYTPGFTSPIIAERGKASKLDRVNYNVERARNAADMRAINRYVETSGGGPANVINKMMAYSKKQQGDAAISAAETKANIGIANTEAQLAQQMELSNLQRAQQASTATAQLAAQEAARADEIEAANAAARQKRIDDMEYMKYQGLAVTAQGIAGIVGDKLDYDAQERLAQVIGTEGIYERQNLIELFMSEGMTKEDATKAARELYNKYNPKEKKEKSV
jgi:hypothetical protein